MDVERSFIGSETRRHQRCLIPIAVLFLGIALQPFFRDAEGSTREVSLYIGILAALGLVLGNFGDADAQEPGKQRTAYSRHAKWVVRALAHLLCLKYDHAVHSVLLRLTSIVVLPLSGVRDADGTLFTIYLGAHFLFTGFHVGGTLAAEGWQWVLILIICDVFLWDMSESMSDQREMQALLNSTSQVVQSLLGTICDGCLLLGDDGTVAGADQKAANLLGLDLEPSANSNAPSSAPRVGCVLEAVLDGGRLIRGLRMLRLPTASEAPVQVEAYIIPFPMAPKDALALGLRMPAPLAAGGRVHLCAFRLADGGFEPKATPTSSGPTIRSFKAGLGQGTPRPMQSLPIPGSAGSAAAVRDRQGYFRPEGSTVDSQLAYSPRTQAASMIGGPTPAHPGIPLQSIQTVGLGGGSYTKVRVVGRGAQAQVWMVTGQDGHVYAQKEIALKGQLWHRDFPKRLRDADREVRALKGLAWASCVIVPIVDCWIQKDFELSCIVMEWLPKSLDFVLKKMMAERSGPVPLPTASNWLARLSAGLGAIHAAGFIHRDLKPSNILLDESLQQCKITDLGVSRALHRPVREHASGASAVSGSARSEAPEEKCSMISENMGSILSGYTVRPGTIAYTSPEARESCHYGCEADMFSLGVVLLEVLTLEMPPEPGLGEEQEDSATMDRAKEVLAQVPPGADPGLWAELRRLCIWMVKARPQDRPTARELCNCRILLPHVDQLVQHCPKMRVVLLHNAA